MDSWVETKQLPVHFVSAAGLVWKDGKVLLIRSQRRGWEIPGGVVEQGEIILDGLKREIRRNGGTPDDVIMPMLPRERRGRGILRQGDPVISVLSNLRDHSEKESRPYGQPGPLPMGGFRPY